MTITLRTIVIITIVLISIFLFLLLREPDTSSLISNPHSFTSYSTSVITIEQIQKSEGSKTNDLCRSQLLTHGRKTEHVIVFFHGYTNCTQQFLRLGKLFYDNGYNVFIPLLPHHGLKDRMTKETEQIRASEFVHFIDNSIDIASGLGNNITVAGISAGGVIAAWAGQNRADVTKAVIIAPNFAYVLPDYLDKPSMNYLLTVPNYFRWWDDKVKNTSTIGPLYAYPRYSTRGMGEFFKLGYKVQKQSREMPPRAHEILVITNAADTSVKNITTKTVIENWKRLDENKVQTFEFGAELNLIHDIIDPNQEKQKIETVYPVLLDLIRQY